VSKKRREKLLRRAKRAPRRLRERKRAEREAAMATVPDDATVEDFLASLDPIEYIFLVDPVTHMAGGDLQTPFKPFMARVLKR